MNLMTDSMERLTNMLKLTDSKLKGYGAEPYGQRKATPKEQREMYENLTEEQYWELIDEHGEKAVNDWMNRMQRGG